MIDNNMNGYNEYCEKLSIPSIYTSVEDFLTVIFLMRQIRIRLYPILPEQ